MNEQPQRKNQISQPRGSTLQRDEGVRLNWGQLGLLTLGQVEQILREGSLETHESFLLLFGPLAQLASGETSQSFSLVGERVRARTADDECMPDWGQFFDALKRERTSEEITDRMMLVTLSKVLWEMHTAQEPILAENGS